MKTTLAIMLCTIGINASAQCILYEDKQLFYNDTLLFTVMEIRDDKELLFQDYLVTDSSQYYDYKLIDTNGRVVMNIQALSNKGRARHSIHFQARGDYFFHATITQIDHISVLAEPETYRFYLFDYLIYKGLITEKGINYDKEFLADFRELHRE